MTWLVLVGGPLDGESKPVRSVPSSYLWAYAPESVFARVRMFRSPGTGRHLYRRDGQRRDGAVRQVSMLYAGHTHAFCCGAFHRRPDVGEWRCSLCLSPVRAAAAMR